MIEKQSQHAAKLTVAKNLVFELEGVLAFLPHESVRRLGCEPLLRILK